MRAGLLFLVPIVVLAIAVSWLLIPRDAEIGLMQLKERDFSDAQSHFEKLYEAGERSVSIAMPLADIYLYKGQVREALTILEEFVAAAPRNVRALKKLAQVQEEAREYGSYLATLGRLYELEPSPDMARLLADLHGYRGAPGKRADYLADVLETGLAEREDFVELALFRADEGRTAEAIAVLEELWQRLPDRFTGGVPELYVQLSLQENDGRTLVSDAAAAMQGRWQPAVANELVSSLLAEERYEMVVALLAPFEAPVQQNAALLQNLTIAELQTGRGDKAFARLFALFEAKVLPAGAHDSLVQLAIERGALDTATSAGAARPFARLPEGLLSDLILTLALAGRGDLLARVDGELDTGIRARRPLMAAELALALDRPQEAAEWVGRMEAGGYGLTATNLIRLARLEVRLGNVAAARRHLDAIAALPEIPARTMPQLVNLYGQLGEEAVGLRLFERLVARTGQAEAIAGWARLAVVAASEEAIEDWLATTPSIGRELLIDLAGQALGARRINLALMLAERAHDTLQDAASRQVLTGALLSAGRNDRVVALLEPHLEQAGPTERQLYVDALIAEGRGPEAYAYLESLQTEGRLQPQLLARYVELAMAADRLDRALAVAEQADIHLVSPATFVALIARTFEAGRREEASRLIDRIGEEALGQSPLLAARIAQARNRPKEVARWLDVARARADLSFEEELEIARLLQSLGRNKEALKRLERLAADPRMPPAALGDLGRLYAEIGEGARGYRLFARLRGERRDAETDAAWARLAAAAGRFREIEEWLEAEDVTDRQLLLDLFYAAQEARRRPLMRIAAAAVAARWPGDEAARLQAEAALADGRPAEAARALKPLVGRDPDVDETYLAALQAAGDWPGVREELARRLAAGDPPSPAARARIAGLLAEPRLDPPALPAGFLNLLVRDLERNAVRGEAAEAHLSALIRLAPKAALPFLDRLEKGSDPDRIAAYEAALERAGDRERLARFLAGRARNESLSREARRAIVFRLIDLGDKAAAETALKQLAAGRPADSEDARQLLFLWGPRPSSEALDWIAAQARESPPERRAGWLRVLNDAGASERVLSVAADQVPAAMPDEVWQHYLRALREARNPTLLQAALLARIHASDSPEDWRSLARLAEQDGASAAARAAWSRVLGVRAADREALSYLAREAYFDGRLEDSRSLFERLLGAGDDAATDEAARDRADRFRAWYRYGEVLNGLGRREQARRAYRMAEELTPPEEQRSNEDARLAAYLDHRLGRTRAALAAFEALLARDPGNPDLRADYANLLIDLGYLDRARAVLGTGGGRGGTG